MEKTNASLLFQNLCLNTLLGGQVFSATRQSFFEKDFLITKVIP